MNSSLSASIPYNNVTFSNRDEISNSFARYFSSVFKKPINQHYEPDNCNMLTIDFNACELELCNVYEKLNCLNTKRCPGSDKISTIIFSECKCVLTIPLLYLLNKSLSSEFFPDKGN